MKYNKPPIEDIIRDDKEIRDKNIIENDTESESMQKI